MAETLFSTGTTIRVVIVKRSLMNSRLRFPNERRQPLKPRERFIRRGDHELFVDVRGDGPALVFAHGLFGTHADGSWLTGPAAGFTIVAPDLRGRGRSSPSRLPREHAFEEHARDLAAILDQLEIAQAIAAGTSFGAAVALSLTRLHPERVRALVLIASAFGAKNDQMGEGNLAAYGDLGERIANEGLESVAQSEAERRGSNRPIERWTPHDEPSLVAWLRAVPIYRPFDRITDLQKVTVPALVVPGQDAIHTRELSESYASALPGAILAGGSTSLNVAVASFLESYR